MCVAVNVVVPVPITMALSPTLTAPIELAGTLAALAFLPLVFWPFVFWPVAVAARLVATETVEAESTSTSPS